MSDRTTESALKAMHRRYDELLRFPDEEWEVIRRLLAVKTVGEKYCLQEIGVHSNVHYFLVDGLVRFYYVTPEGKEVNKGFYGQGNIVGSLSATILDEPSRFGIETLEPSLVVVINLDKIKPYVERTPAWQRLYMHSCEMMLIRNERREAELLTMTAKQRFQQFMRNFPDYFDRIPQYHIASYLGITPVALSKYKKKWLETS